MLDLLIRGATVFDGSGAAPVTADVAVRDGRIAEVGRTAEGARRVVDAVSSAQGAATEAAGRWPALRALTQQLQLQVFP